LRDTGLITVYKEGDTLEPGKLIEIQASLRISPVLKACENLAVAYKTALIFTKQETPQIVKSAQKSSQRLQKPHEQEGSAEYAVRIVSEIADSMRSGSGLDLVTSKLHGEMTAVITIEQQFLNDAKMADLMDGSFKVAGKVVRVATSEGESIDLLRNSQFGVLTPKFLADLFGSFQSMREFVQFPEPETAVKAPAFQMIPIAIYT
jgi:hypothetical protein